MKVDLNLMKILTPYNYIEIILLEGIVVLKSVLDPILNTVCRLAAILLLNIQSIGPLAWGTVYCASNCTDFSNFIFAIKQGGLEKT